MRPGRIPDLPDRPCPCGGAPAPPPPGAKRKRGRPPKPRAACKVCGDTGIMLWQPLTREWWREVWRSPMAREYLRADHHALYRLAVLVDRFWAEGADPRIASELRLQQMAFGLTPLDRARLQWQIEQPLAKDEAEKDEAPPVYESRDVLRALK